MSFFKRLLLILIAILALGMATLASVEAQTSPNPGIQPFGLVIPDGFERQTSTFGVDLYRKNYPGGTPDFVQVVDFSKGAAIELLHGPIQENRQGKGAYGGDDPRIASRSLKQFWNELASSVTDPFCVVNGQFFYMPESPTRLPFPLKVDGEIVSDGYGKEQFQGKKLMLEMWEDHADIRVLSREALYESSAPNIIAGLAEDAPKNIKKYVGRTFVAVVDGQGDGLYETVLIFSTRTARQVDAASVLRSFGAAKIMMLDGGGSTQLICRDQPIIASERLIPQAIGVKGGVPPSPFSDDVQISAADQPVVANAAPFVAAQAEVAVEVANPEAVAVEAPAGQPVSQPASQPASEPTGDQVMEEPAPYPVHEAEALAVSQPEVSPEAMPLPEENLVVQPVDAGESPAELLIAASAEESPPAEPLYDLSGVLLVPAMMAPAMGFVFLIVLKMKFG